MVSEEHALHEEPNEGEVLEPGIKSTTGTTGNKRSIICQWLMFIPVQGQSQLLQCYFGGCVLR